MIDLDELREQGERLRTASANDAPIDADVLETWIADMLDHMGMGSNRIADQLDCVVLLAVWARVMESANPEIAVMGWRETQGYMLNATAPAGMQINLERAGVVEPRYPALTLRESRSVRQLVFYSDSRPSSWLRKLFENRAHELLAGAYYEHEGVTMPPGGMPDGSTRRPRSVKS